MWKQRYIHKCFTNMTTYDKIKWFTLPEHFNEKEKNLRGGPFLKLLRVLFLLYSVLTSAIAFVILWHCYLLFCFVFTW